MSEEVDLLPHLLLPLAGPEEFEEEEMDGMPIDLQYLPPEKVGAMIKLAVVGRTREGARAKGE